MLLLSWKIAKKNLYNAQVGSKRPQGERSAEPAGYINLRSRCSNKTNCCQLKFSFLLFLLLRGYIFNQQTNS